MRRVNASGICRQGSWRSGVLDKDAHRSTIISRDGSPGYILFFVLWAYVGIVYGVHFYWRGHHTKSTKTKRKSKIYEEATTKIILLDMDIVIPERWKISLVGR